MAQSHFILIIGCGRLGALLANNLSGEGHRVVVVDNNAEAFDKLSVQFSGFKVVGDAIELAVLRQAYIEKAQYVFAVTTQDNVNIMVAQIAKEEFKVDTVVARVFDPVREQIYSELGIDTISPTQLTALAFAGVLQGQRPAIDPDARLRTQEIRGL